MKRYALAVCAALGLSLALTTAPVRAQDKPTQPGKMAGKPAMKGPVYTCSECKVYYSPDAAKKMGYKDPMGHKMTKMDKAPAGYTMGSDMKMGGKMGDKMGGATKASSVYVCSECKVYYTPAEAKKMGYKDPMGHKMEMKPAAPAGYTSGSKMKPNDKMKPKM